MNARLRLQRLGAAVDQCLVVAQLAQLRGEGSFRTSDVQALFVSLRVPPPANVSRELGVLRQRGLVFRPTTTEWAITPEGEAQLGDISLEWSAADLQTIYQADFAGQVHHTIPAHLAPQHLVGPIDHFLEEHAFDRNVFGITRFPGDPGTEDGSEQIDLAIVESRQHLAAYGLELHLASDRSVADELWPNVSASMWACRYGLAIVEDRAGVGLNRNVLIEVGGMLMTGRRCVLLKDRSVDGMPTDLVGHIYKSVDLDDPESIASAVREWCENDLGLDLAS